MGKEKLITKHGHNMFEISSMIQKALRRADSESAYYAANEMLASYRGYLWKRLLCVSAEDCYDMVTSPIVGLMKKDEQRTNPLDSSNVSKAVSILLKARKNRDADYFACNLLNSRDKRSLRPYIEDEKLATQCPSKNGHDMFDLAAHLGKAIDCNDSVAVGYSANELYQRYRSFLWDTLVGKVIQLGFSRLTAEVYALRKVDDEQQSSKNVSTIYVSKAIVLILKVAKYRSVGIYDETPVPDEFDLSRMDNAFKVIPDYVFDCHTYLGKVRGKTKRDFVVTEQRSLRPYIQGEYDLLSWDRYFQLSEIGFYDANNLTPRPAKEVLKELNGGSLQLNLFGE